MLKDEIMKLVNAGFSKEEIFKYFPEDIPGDPPASEPEQKPEQEPEQEPETTPENNIDNKVLKDYMSQVNALFDDMTKTLKDIQAANTRNANFPEVPVTTAEDIIGKIIAPQNYRKEE